MEWRAGEEDLGKKALHVYESCRPKVSKGGAKVGKERDVASGRP